MINYQVWGLTAIVIIIIDSTRLPLQTLGPFNVFILLGNWICLHSVLEYAGSKSVFECTLDHCTLISFIMTSPPSPPLSTCCQYLAHVIWLQICGSINKRAPHSPFLQLQILIRKIIRNNEICNWIAEVSIQMWFIAITISMQLRICCRFMTVMQLILSQLHVCMCVSMTLCVNGCLIQLLAAKDQ